jgi:hypothetical protein
MVLYDSKAPGVYIHELSGGARPIQAVGTSTAGFLGVAPNKDAPMLQPIPINNWTEFIKTFGANGSNGNNQPAKSNSLACAVYGFFQNCGTRCYVVNLGTSNLEAGLRELARIDEIAIVAAPGSTKYAEYDALINHCENLKDRVAILDAPLKATLDQLITAGEGPQPPFTIADDGTGKDLPEGVTAKKQNEDLVLTGTGNPGETVKLLDAKNNKLGDCVVKTDRTWEITIPFPEEKDESFTLVQPTGGVKPRLSAYAAYYYPWILTSDPLHPDAKPQYTPPSGHIAGIWARSDANRGVHKAPANEPINGALGVPVRLTDDEQGGLNQAGVNCIRFFAREGVVVWGARTLAADPQWRYLNVRRLFNMIEESIQESTRWIVFEPNDETLWKAIRRDVTAFLTRIWRTGALMGSTPDQAFFVKCDAETNPPEDIDAGKVTIVIGIAPVKPAEFVVFEIGQLEAGSQVTEK